MFLLAENVHDYILHTGRIIMDQNSQYNGNSYPYPDEPDNRQPVSPHPVVVNQLEHKKDGLAVCSLVTGIL